jgi:predicted porin
LENYKMRKTQVALAALALMASTAAFADGVTVSGAIDWGVQSSSLDVSGGANTSRTSAKTSSLAPNWLIFSADEDLGGGLKINGTYQVALGLGGSAPAGDQPRASNGGWLALGQKVTISGDFGAVTVGDWLDPFFLSASGHSAGTDGGSNIGGILNPLFATGTGGVTVGSTGAWERSLIIYDAPNLNGLKLSYAHRFGGVDERSSAAGFDTLTGNYAIGALNASAAWKSQRDVTGDGKQTSTLLGAGYDSGFAKFNILNIRKNANDWAGSGNQFKWNTMGYNVTVPMDSWVFGVSYYQTKVSDFDEKGSTAVLSAHYNMSKRTKIYANYQTLKNIGDQIYTLNHGGNAQDLISTGSGNDGKASAFTVGVRHSF